ncbi:B12-binding domain-containing radical SAM protein [Candidatus Magnetobacterium casense]|uniref:B12-binding domain-containing radical SAM protein n=1 Tax=Candidatus Magnetobacterium casense TaxID=1455061 RepID=UPI000696BB48|nr:radical SAM protein [Candidatus Magnetobacterium casensis]
MKTIAFIETRSPLSNIFRRFPIPRLGAVLLSTLLRQQGYEVKTFIEDIRTPDWSFIERSDLLCISTITSTVHVAYETADRARKLGIPVVMGGAHPTFMAGEALQHANFVIRGEGERALLQLVESLKSGTPALNSINGLSYRDKAGNDVHNPPSEFVADLDSLPDPDYTLVHGWRNSNIHPIATSRGCAFNCRFCLVSPMFGRRYRFRSVERVVNELRRIASVSRSPLFFVDDNFAANKKRTKEILRRMIAEGIKPRWSAMVRPDIYRDEELLGLLARSGKFTASIGFESTSAQALKDYNKHQKVDDNIRCVAALKTHGIKIHGMFVFGADTDTIETITDSAEFSIDSGLDSVQFMILTPLPGTALYEDFKATQRLLHTDWSKYDINHVVYKTATIKPQHLQVETIKAMERFYSLKHFWRHMKSLDLFYAAFGLYSRRMVKKALKDIQGYADSLNQ